MAIRYVDIEPDEGKARPASTTPKPAPAAPPAAEAPAAPAKPKRRKK